MRKINLQDKKVWFLALAALLLIGLPQIITSKYIMHLVNLIGIYVLLTMGFNILTGYTGLVSLGQAGFYAIGAYTTSLCNRSLGISPWISMLCGIVVTMIFGFILALPALRVKDKYLVLLTIGFAEIVRLIALNWIDLTHGPSGIGGIEAPSFFGIALDTSAKFYYLILACVFFAFVYQYILMKSRAGRAFIAIREDEKAAQLAGIDLTNYKIKSFMISAVLSGMAGVLYAHSIHYISPDTFTYNESVTILCMGIIGGIGTLSGPLIGAVLLTALPEMLRGFASVRMIVYGLSLIVMISVSPGGLAGAFVKARRAFVERRKKARQNQVQAIPKEDEQP